MEKGQSGYMILAPVTGRFATATPSDPESWRRLGKGEKPRPGEVVRSKMITAKPAYVWDASQTAGDLIPEPPAPKLLEGEAPVGLWDGLAGLVEERGFTVLRVPHEGMIHGANGVTDYTAKTVAVRENGSAPLGWHQDFAEARERLHDWVAACGSRLDRDRATRQTAWPGEEPAPSVEEIPIEDRSTDFRRFVVEGVARRRAVEDAFIAAETRRPE